MQGLSGTGQRICHVRVAEVAKAAAAELYEVTMSNNQYYVVWRKQNPGANAKELQQRFVDRNWGKCIDFAVQTLTLMLRDPRLDEKAKDEIMDVLEKQQSIKGRRVA